ncbi:MAG: hypothetical protein Q8S84_00640 [bacterium]|nr:hypothetical protein [bacterium]
MFEEKTDEASVKYQKSNSFEFLLNFTIFLSKSFIFSLYFLKYKSVKIFI